MWQSFVCPANLESYVSDAYVLVKTSDLDRSDGGVHMKDSPWSSGGLSHARPTTSPPKAVRVKKYNDRRQMDNLGCHD
jgi:hypothetical protein